MRRIPTSSIVELLGVSFVAFRSIILESLSFHILATEVVWLGFGDDYHDFNECNYYYHEP